jgi:molecular chaperone DnaJ
MADTDGFRNDWATKDFYQVLGVAQDASAAQIKTAYRKLARANHPDSNPGDDAKHEKFKAVAEAYDVLGDEAKRAKYDEFRSLQARGGFGPGMGGGGGGFGGGGFNLDDLLRDRGGSGGIGDMFGDLFGGGQRARPQQARPRRGADVESTATIGFTDALDGVTVSLRLTSDAACATCHGSGRGTSARSIQARIPAGVKDGAKIRLKGKGAPGENGGPAGDLFVTVKVTPHRVFGRKGDNLTLDVPVSFDEAALGAEVKIPTLGGAPVTLKLPAGTPNGRTFRVRGKGATRRDGSKGDLLATIDVQVPATLDQTAREALEAYRAATAGKPLRNGLFE